MKKSDNTEKIKEKSRKYSIKDGIFATIKDSVANNYISPFAIALNSSNYLIAMLSSIPGILGPLSQLFSSRLIEKYPRKRIIVNSVTIEILTWIPLIITAILFYYGILVSLLPLMLLIFFSIYVITANIGNPAWFSLIGDLVDEDKRGRWFAKRTAIFAIITIIFTVSSAFLLDFLKKKNQTILGFIILFSIAIISRIISRYYLNKHYEPKLKIEKKYYFSFFRFIKKAPYNNFGRFAIFRALIALAATIAGPFFAVYMLRELNFNYITFIIITMSATFFSLIAVGLWGKFSDKYGNYEVLKITIVIISACPIAWIFSKNILFLILIPQVLSGIGWSGFDLAASNYIFDCVTPQKRSLAVSYYNLLNGIGVFLGGIIGALLIDHLKISFMNIFLFIFLISGLGRLIIGLIMIPKIREVEQREKFSLFKLMSFKKDKLINFLNPLNHH